MALQEKRKVSRRELLELRERPWANRLRALSLVAEYDVKTAFADQTLSALGHLYRGLAGHGSERARLLRRYPAVHVVSVTHAATFGYHQGGFWPQLASRLQVDLTQQFRCEWGEAFLDNLSTLGLPTFANAETDAGSRFVGRILLHCGVPNACLEDYFRLIHEQRTQRPGLSSTDFVAWAAARAEAGRLHNIDMPVGRFMRFGGEFAVDVTDRVFDLLDDVQANGTGDSVPLPERFRTRAVDLRASGNLVRSARRRAGSSDDFRPRVILDPYGRGPLLQLPPVGEAPDGRAVWVLDLDGDIHRVPTLPLWPGSREPAPITTHPIPRPIRVASAALEGREELTTSLLVVDDADPLLAFDEEGQRLSVNLPLPRGAVWLLLPGPFEDLSFEGAERLLAETALPPGWNHWSLILVDLAAVDTVTLGARTHSTRNVLAAQIETAEPVVGVLTSEGRPVYGGLPTIHLPSVSVDEVSWDVSLADARGTLMSRVSVTNSVDPESLWSALPRPLLGTFTVRVRGPWGRSAAKTLFIAEGLSLRCEPSWRRLASNGLVPGRVEISTAQGMRSSRETVELGPSDRTTHITVHTADRSTALVVTPPHMSFAYQSNTTTTPSTVQPMTLHTEDVIEDPGTLLLDVGVTAQPTLTLIGGGSPLQELSTPVSRTGVHRLALDQVVDTLRSNPHTAVALGDEGQVIIASIRPRRLFSDIRLEGHALVFDECVNVDGMMAHVFQARAPWAPAVSLPVREGVASLPAPLQRAGPLHVTVRVEDPWIPEPIPDWPGIRQSKVIESPGWPSSGDPEANSLSAFLAGEGPLPDVVSDHSRLWFIRSRVRSLLLGDSTAAKMDAVDAALFSDPRSALESLANSAIAAHQIPSLVVRSGLAWARLAAAHDDVAPPWTARGAVPALLLSAADSEWSAEEIDAAESVCGEVVAQILDGKDPHPSAGRLDAGADLFADNPRRREAMVSLMGLVPHGLLGNDSRVIAAMDLISKRDDPDLKWVVFNAHQFLQEADVLLDRVGSPRARKALNARRHPTARHGWRCLSALSLALALSARLAARGSEPAAQWIASRRRVWGDLAKVAPQLVTVDLILGELITASTTRDIE